MKILLLVSLIVMLFPTSALAQIEMNSKGNVQVGGGTVTDLYKLRAECSASTNCGVGAPSMYGIHGKAEGGAFSTGVYGLAIKGSVTNYGIRGSASGGSTNWAGYFSGNVYATGTYQGSDERVKSNIEELEPSNMLALVLELKARRYRYLSDDELRQRDLPALHLPSGSHFGLIAQDLETMFPDMVIDVVHPPDKPGAGSPISTKAVSYTELIPILISAIQAQQAEIDALQSALESAGIPIQSRQRR